MNRPTFSTRKKGHGRILCFVAIRSPFRRKPAQLKKAFRRRRPDASYMNVFAEGFFRIHSLFIRSPGCANKSRCHVLRAEVTQIVAVFAQVANLFDLFVVKSQSSFG
ncbi:hypothetical protein [Saccharibacillus endophyticus]|uniref:hypothetical protein n=1 Tax=Saccharibacillus endophyticus TaxID=2060666 RepID=UPI0015579ACA|nr:hypothetical protein [Saccharibacillus endophyticus]